MMLILDYIESKYHILNCALDSIGLGEMKRFFYADFIGVGEALISGTQEKSGITLEVSYKQFLTKFFTEAMAEICVDWLKNYRRQDREKIVRYLSTTV